MKETKNTETYVVTRRELLQLCPVPGGTRAVFREDGGTGFTLPVLALALVEEWDEVRSKTGLLLETTSEKRRAIAGVGPGEYFDLHENADNLFGYLAPGENMREVFDLPTKEELEGNVEKA